MGSDGDGVALERSVARVDGEVETEVTADADVRLEGVNGIQLRKMTTPVMPLCATLPLPTNATIPLRVAKEGLI